jgi:hypothetical protein
MNTRQKQTSVAIGVVLLILLAVAGFLVNRSKQTQANTSRPFPAASGQAPRGRITAVSSNSITIQSRAGGPKTFTIAANAAVTLDGQPSSVSALQARQRAAITSADGVTATEIKVRTRRAGGRRFGGGQLNNASPAPATAPSVTTQ